MSDAIELLRPVELFQHLNEEQLSLLAEHSREVQFRKHAILMTEGDAGESMYVIHRVQLRFQHWIKHRR